MKAGFWDAPDGADEPMTIAPVGAADAPSRRRTISMLASAAPHELTSRCARAAALLPELASALEAQEENAKGRLFDLTDFGDDDRELIDQIVGEGEVAGVVTLPDGVGVQIQEATMAGLWRVRFTDARDRLFADYLEVGSIPEVVRRAAVVNAREIAFAEPPKGAANALPILTEIAERSASHRPGAPGHVINFTLLPMSPQDLEFLQGRLGTGPVHLISRGYGSCRVVSSAVRNVWSVQYFNAMDTIILDTLEIGDTPSVACAAKVDFEDSAERLREIMEAYFQ